MTETSISSFPRQDTPRTNNLASYQGYFSNSDQDMTNGHSSGASTKETESTTAPLRAAPVSKSHVAFAAGTHFERDATTAASHQENPGTQISNHSQLGASDESEDAIQTAANASLNDTPVSIELPSTVNSRRKIRRRRGQVPNSSASATSHSESFKRRKRGRRVRVVSVLPSPITTNDHIPSNSYPPLPGNQYTTTLRRRAIRKLEEKPETNGHRLEGGGSEQQQDDDEEEFGDISLGMKLIVVGGRVIVQTLNSLADGRASPAQTVGNIRRGDVLLAIDNLSLVNLPIDQLMYGLKPLSSPATADGRYKRVLKLRFEAGAGHDLLKSHEQGHNTQTLQGGGALDGSNAVNDMFTLFPMVDQLSGAPLFDVPPKVESKPPSAKEESSAEEEQLNSGDVGATHSRDDSTEVEISPDEQISSLLAQQHILDQRRFASEYFNWNEKLSDLLKQTVDALGDASNGMGLTETERVELGMKVMRLTKQLTFGMEEVDKGKDLRSFKTWSTNFSLRSGASARRRHMMDAVSLRSHRTQEEADAAVDNSVMSSPQGSLGSVDGDALLLRLAAHDDIWKKQVVDALQKSVKEMDGDNYDEEEVIEAAENIDAALSNQMGSFLFGENMNNIIAKKRKSHSLPPVDITTVLFDLATHIATAAPDEVTVFGGGTTTGFSHQSSSGAQGRGKSQMRSDILLANQFILEEVLPIWLESFHPLGFDQRRLFWPKIKQGSTASYTGTNTHSSDNDSLTVESAGTPSQSLNRSKNLQETIEDLELDVETRAETCFLVTYYFRLQILAQYPRCQHPNDTALLDEKMISFVQKFGCYLQIHSSLAFAASVESAGAVNELLKVANHDPSHRDAVREIRKADDLTFYDPMKLSAVLEFLQKIRQENSQQIQKVVKNLCVSAYPDIQPWQVKRACLEPVEGKPSGSPKGATENDLLRDFYYSYLSLLLDPSEGDEAARQNSKLVTEWCKMSIEMSGDREAERLNPSKYLQNFYRVASRTSSAHLSYHRDLPLLLEMSMSIKEYSLALELTSEIIESKRNAPMESTARRVLTCLREIGMEGLNQAWDSREEESDGSGFHMLKRVLRAFHQMSCSDISAFQNTVNVSNELLTSLNEWTKKSKSDDFVSNMLILIDFMIMESSPQDVLTALVQWTNSNDLGPAIFERLQSLLRRGAEVALRSELSGSLLRLKEMRRGYMDDNKAMIPVEKKEDEDDIGGIWQRMSIGTLSIDK